MPCCASDPSPGIMMAARFGIGVQHIDTPLTAEQIWRALHGGIGEWQAGSPLPLIRGRVRATIVPHAGGS
jgi:hypothetical protein